jgi:hypothetical protein
MLYKTIDIPNWREIGHILLKHFPEEYKTSGGFRGLDPALFEKCKPLVDGISKYTTWDNLSQIAVVSVPPKKIWPIHTDWLITFPYSLNIPIYNCTEETYTSFYKITNRQVIKDPTEEELNAANYLNYNSIPKTHLFDLDEVEEIERYYLIEPTLYRIDVPHSIFNTGTDIRMSISIRFKKWVDF